MIGPPERDRPITIDLTADQERVLVALASISDLKVAEMARRIFIQALRTHMQDILGMARTFIDTENIK